MSVSLLFGLLPYWNYTNIDNSSYGWDILVKFLGDILRTLIHYFQIILIFYVCQSVSWLTFLLRYLQFWLRYISEFFWRLSWNVCILDPNISECFYVCQSVSWLTSLLKLGLYGYNSISGWDIILKMVMDISGMFVQKIKIILKFLYVCQFLSCLTSSLKKCQ